MQNPEQMNATRLAFETVLGRRAELTVVPQPQLTSKPASSYTMRAISWSWPGSFAIGKLAIIAGLPDKGKGLISCSLIAACTSDQPMELPCGEGHTPKGRAIWFSAEDDIEDTVTPRLAAAGANLDK